MFTYWETGETAVADFANDQELTVEQAQVVATLAVARQLEGINSALTQLDYFMRNIPFMVEHVKSK